ncbi:anthranilate synthase component II [Alkalibacter saccharofermentans]|jgi:anthranilate synthase/aminodeoxychorismate synthase-like glutamine amidotransferase|uniref:Anthranilate synthase component 2 n=1 Tax=Alkalibacter saccharofermentans DSM 14828 TaxID=1120975 RepID=A0A1M4W1P3_9FIRM|nr:aminodeoxychorismate/anthranilate synthase component II [Alkalibacter saccharofermentans]SHE75043.1 anthranilate synthase component 2 [Alkalibacter saccharofermentans DSM 14828]
MIVIIDNYDSFTYNLYQYIGEIDPNIKVIRNDETTIEELLKLAPRHIVISPGPGYPKEAGISEEVIETFGKETPVLGVCLGHQAIAEVFGGKIIENDEMFHGKTSLVDHDGKEIFEGIENPVTVMRYHSLTVEEESLPGCLNVTAKTRKGEIMAISHKDYPIYGVQFHPESIMTQNGKKMLENFLKM